jgi:predicted SprT family Zn-dependent metalloprotease
MMNLTEKMNYVESQAEKFLREIKVGISPYFKSHPDKFGFDGEVTLAQLGWKFKWNRGKRLVGLCDYQTKTIQISLLFTKNVGSPENFNDTLLHEIAHALTPGAKHGADWKKACVLIGAKPERICDNSNVVGANSSLALWKARCAQCGYLHTRHRRPKYINSLRCVATAMCKSNKTPLVWSNNDSRSPNSDYR